MRIYIYTYIYIEIRQIQSPQRRCGVDGRLNAAEAIPRLAEVAQYYESTSRIILQLKLTEVDQVAVLLSNWGLCRRVEEKLSSSSRFEPDPNRGITGMTYGFQR